MFLKDHCGCQKHSLKGTYFSSPAKIGAQALHAFIVCVHSFLICVFRFFNLLSLEEASKGFIGNIMPLGRFVR